MNNGLEQGDAAGVALVDRLAAAGDLAGAVQALRAVLERQPEDADLCGRLGLLLYELGFDTESIAHLKFARRRSETPDHWRKPLREVTTHGLKGPDRLRLDDAFTALAQGRPGEAAPVFQELVAKRPRSLEARLGLRGALHALDRADEAAEAAAAWRQAWPPHRAGLEAVLARRLSRRGLVFDPHDPLPVRPIGEVLMEVETAEEMRRTPNSFVRLDAHKRPIDCAPVISLEPDGSDAMKIHRSTIPRLMARFDDALLYGIGLVVSRSGAVVSEFLAGRKFRVELEDGSIRFGPGSPGDGASEPGSREVSVFDAPGLLMAGPTDRSCGDWINQYPTRLAIAEAAGVDCPPVVRAKIGDRYVEMLTALGVNPDKLMRHHGFVSIFSQLYVPSWPLTRRQNPMPGWFDIYRRAWAPAPSERRRIYLTRLGVSHRSLVNEPEIGEIFARRGFDIVAPETLDMGQMIELFAGPSIVAGPYGSAMRSLVFCRQKPTVFTIMPPYSRRFVNGSGLFFAQAGVRFAWVQGTPAPEIGHGHPNEVAWYVDPALVESRLDRLLDYLAANPESS